jgi:EAL domain-containing protein (putative c-di-GMP-specific phosphodiesterase class I)
LTAPEFQQTVVDKLQYYKIPAAKICFEITETAAISNLTDAIAFIDAMHERGCRFALDDFGTGLSSFAYLKYLPVDYLKIDGVFVKGIVEDPIDYAMVKSIHEVATVMGKKTVAEFVENSDIELKLKEIGVHYSQGYGIAKPCPMAELAGNMQTKSSSKN